MCEDIQRKNADAAFCDRATIVTFVEVKKTFASDFLE
jgi:hypothetical protein